MERYGMVLRVKPGKIERYKELHAAVWPEVLEVISECNIQNYSIYLKDDLLFSYFEYVGNDFGSDMKKMADAEITKKWWAECMPCQEPLPTAAEGEWWSVMEEVFHWD